ncbi:MAG: hypothetical protein HY719_12985 [Planctomycetes bacterium]|nr:hypothetical protein [Planctomycetota bacterium]
MTPPPVLRTVTSSPRMRRRAGSLVLAVLAALAAFSPLAAQEPRGAAAELAKPVSVIVDAQVGLARVYRARRWNPVQVDLTNVQEREIEGSLELREHEDSVLRAVHRAAFHLAPREQRRRYTFYVRGASPWSGSGTHLDLMIVGKDGHEIVPRKDILGGSTEEAPGPPLASPNDERVNRVLLAVARDESAGVSAGNIVGEAAPVEFRGFNLGGKSGATSAGVARGLGAGEDLYCFSVPYDRLPDRSIGYDLLDAMALVEPDEQKFPRTADPRALELWVRGGGHLIVCGGERQPRGGVGDGFLGALLPIAVVTEIVDVPGEEFLARLGERFDRDRLLRDAGGVIRVARVTLKPDARVTRTLAGEDATDAGDTELALSLSGATLPLAVTRDVDLGSVTFVTFNPFGGGALRKAPGAVSNFLGHVAKGGARGRLPAPSASSESDDKTPNPWSYGATSQQFTLSNLNGALQDMLGDFRAEQVSLWPIVALLVGYLILAGPAPYFVLRRRRPYLGTLIGTALVTAGGAVVMVVWNSAVGLGRARENRLTVVDMMSSSDPLVARAARARVNAFFTVFSRSNSDYRYRHDAASRRVSLFRGGVDFDPYAYRRGYGVVENEDLYQKGQPACQVTVGEKTGAVSAFVGKWSVRPFEGGGVIDTADRRVSLSVSRRGGKYRATVVNHAGVPLSDCVVYHKNFATTPQAVADGATGELYPVAGRDYEWARLSLDTVEEVSRYGWRGVRGRDPTAKESGFGGGRALDHALLWSFRSIFTGLAEARDKKGKLARGEAFEIHRPTSTDGDFPVPDLSAEITAGRAVLLAWAPGDLFPVTEPDDTFIREAVTLFRVIAEVRDAD